MVGIVGMMNVVIHLVFCIEQQPENCNTENGCINTCKLYNDCFIVLCFCYQFQEYKITEDINNASPCKMFVVPICDEIGTDDFM